MIWYTFGLFILMFPFLLSLFTDDDMGFILLPISLLFAVVCWIIGSDENIKDHW